MATCTHCRRFVVSGVTEGNLRFCSDDCHQRGFLVPLAERVAPEAVAEQVQAVHQQTCPKCGGAGPIDVVTTHTAVSVIVMTSWKDQAHVCCAACGKKAVWQSIVLTALFGWWGFPFGLLLTPWQLAKNFKSLTQLPQPAQPSADIRYMVSLDVARRLQAEDSEGEIPRRRSA